MVIKEKDRKIMVGENRLFLDHDNILYLDIVGEHDKEIAERIRDAYAKILNQIDEKVNIFVNNTHDKRSSSEARKIFREMTEDEKAKVKHQFIKTINKYMKRIGSEIGYDKPLPPILPGILMLLS